MPFLKKPQEENSENALKLELRVGSMVLDQNVYQISELFLSHLFHPTSLLDSLEYVFPSSIYMTIYMLCESIHGYQQVINFLPCGFEIHNHPENTKYSQVFFLSSNF